MMSDHYQTVCNAFENTKERELAADIYRRELWNRVESGEIDTDTAIGMLQEQIDRQSYLQEMKETKKGHYSKVPEFRMTQPEQGGCSGLSHEQWLERQSRLGL
ncbi:MAG: hypothetical protein LWW87_12115 [Geobacteraceae bacterium]|nr:hypothetical protein [Geobacteraceae bacterium]